MLQANVCVYANRRAPSSLRRHNATPETNCMFGERLHIYSTVVATLKVRAPFFSCVVVLRFSIFIEQMLRSRAIAIYKIYVANGFCYFNDYVRLCALQHSVHVCLVAYLHLTMPQQDKN